MKEFFALLLAVTFFCVNAAAQTAPASPDSAPLAGPGAKTGIADSASAQAPAAGSSIPADLGRLRILSTPDSAIVVVDSVDRGRTPLAIDSLPAGEHDLLLKKKGYFIKKARVLVEAGREQEVSFELIKPCRLVITSAPAGATVAINNQNVGVTPYLAEKLTPAAYEIRVEARECSTATGSVVLASGGRDSLHFALRPVVPTPGTAAGAKPAARSPVMTIVSVSVFALFCLMVLVVELTR